MKNSNVNSSDRNLLVDLLAKYANRLVSKQEQVAELKSQLYQVSLTVILLPIFLLILLYLSLSISLFSSTIASTLLSIAVLNSFWLPRYQKIQLHQKYQKIISLKLSRVVELVAELPEEESFAKIIEKKLRLQEAAEAIDKVRAKPRFIVRSRLKIIYKLLCSFPKFFSLIQILARR